MSNNVGLLADIATLIQNPTPMHLKILVMGLPGAGKTTLAKLLAARLPAVHFNADEVRQQLNNHLGFTEADRIEHARRMGWLCDQVVKARAFAIADFVCPIPETRRIFMQQSPAFIVWVDRVQEGRFEDTNRLFVPPDICNVRVTAEGSAEHWARQVATRVLEPKT